MADGKAAVAIAAAATGETGVPTISGEAAALASATPDESVIGAVMALEARAADPAGDATDRMTAQMVLAQIRALVTQATVQKTVATEAPKPETANIAAAGTIKTPEISGAGAVAATVTTPAKDTAEVMRNLGLAQKPAGLAV